MTLIPPMRGRRRTPLGWAARAIGKELFGFRFDFPIATVPAAGPRESLHYYIYSDRLFFDAMEADPRGIPVHRSRTFETYNPAYVAWYGLMSLERWLRGRDSTGRQTFLRQVDWLRTHAVARGDGGVVWPLTFDWQEGDCLLKAPWISAMLQGLAISALVRGYRLSGDRRLIDQCQRATEVFKKTIEDGGVRTLEGGQAVYEEYPGFPLPRVLDGYLFALLGLYDLFAQTSDPTVLELFADGIGGLRHLLPFWDYRGKWSWYGSHGYLCPPQYHKLNCALLEVLGRVSGDPTLKRYAQTWAPTGLTMLGRAQVFLVFLATKNRCRLKYRLRRPRLSRGVHARVPYGASESGTK